MKITGASKENEEVGNLPDKIDSGTPGLAPDHLGAIFRQLEGCCLHSPVWTPADAERVLCSVWHTYGEGWRDSAVPDEIYGGWKGGNCCRLSARERSRVR
jgi:hypothetical protein